MSHSPSWATAGPTVVIRSGKLQPDQILFKNLQIFFHCHHTDQFKKSILGNVFVIKKSSKKSSKHSLSSFFSVCASREEEEKDEGRPLQAAFQEELHHAAGGGGESDALSPLSDWLKGGR